MADITGFERLRREQRDYRGKKKISELSYKELKEIAKARGIDTKGKKRADLIKALR